MKTLRKSNLKFVPLLGILFLLGGCDLELQEGFDFVPEVDAIDPYAEISAWEFIQSQDELNEDGNISGENFNYMIAAIERAGMIDEYNGTDPERTYLLLNNNAFTGGGDIIQLVTGSSSVADGETPEQVMARADVNVLRTILEYHIVTTYIDQVPTLFEFDIWYLFQTLIPGEDGVIAFIRDNRYRISINGKRNNVPASPLPISAYTQFEGVRNHNYVFNNGIGHVIADPVRNQPYPAPVVP